MLIPAALGGMIHADNAERIRARIVLEGANSPTTPAADAILADNGVLVIPDVLANAGGVIVSYFEWVQNLQHFHWDEREVHERLAKIMRRSLGEVQAARRRPGLLVARGGLRAGHRARRRGAAPARHVRLSGGRGQAVRAAATSCRPSSAIACSRIRNFWTLPVTVIGKASTSLT